MRQPGMTRVLTTMHRSEAEIVSGVLGATGVFNIIDADDTGQKLPALGLTNAIRVLVRDEDLEKAREILRQARAEGAQIPPDAEDDSEPE